MERESPHLYTSNMAKRARHGKIFLDYLRNGRNATFIAPYSPRARDNAPVAVPITWEVLAHGVERSQVRRRDRVGPPSTHPRGGCRALLWTVVRPRRMARLQR